MALSIGVKAGRKICIGGTHMLCVREILAPNQVRITFDDKEMLVTDLERTELMAEVFVSCGLSDSQPGSQYTRLAFEAPRVIRIERVR